MSSRPLPESRRTWCESPLDWKTSTIFAGISIERCDGQQERESASIKGERGEALRSRGVLYDFSASCLAPGSSAGYCSCFERRLGTLAHLARKPPHCHGWALCRPDEAQSLCRDLHAVGGVRRHTCEPALRRPDDPGRDGLFVTRGDSRTGGDCRRVSPRGGASGYRSQRRGHWSDGALDAAG